MFVYPTHFLIGFAISFLPVLNVLAKAPPAPSQEPQVVREEVVAVVLETETPEAGEEPTVLAAATEEQVSETSTPSPTPTPTPMASTLKTTPTPKPTESAILTPKPTMDPTESPKPTETPVAVTAVLATPTPVPTATPVIIAPTWMDPWFTQYSSEYNVDKNVLIRIAECESKFNAEAGTKEKYFGMFQFSVETWQSYRGPGHMGRDTNPDLRANPEEAIRTAAYMIFKTGKTSHWPSC